MADEAENITTGGGISLLDRIKRAFRHGDIMFALGIIIILIVFILPMPKWLLDVGLAISITFSVMILMTVLFIEKPLEFSTFPSVLLIATMMRLALNLASTKLILAEGYTGPAAAGNVIQAFGGLLMKGSFIIGITVFAILVLVNFIVITKGSGRIAEVAARFSLDAMPGKQMAIDADLSAGIIDESEAKTRRKELEQESTFFGSMDGASKFVRGDAIAGLLITAINVIVGMIIGTSQEGLSVGEAANTYTLLTVGDGLVTQIPAFIVSVSAGLLVSKAGVAGTADAALTRQLGAHPKVLGMTSGVLIAFALLPGIPTLTFLALAAFMGGLAYFLPKHRAKDKIQMVEEQQELERKAEESPSEEEPISTALAMDNIRLELGYGLLALMKNEGENQLTTQVKGLRKQLAAETGFVMPSVRIQDNLQLPANTYVIYIKEIEAGRGDIRPNRLLCMDSRGEDISIPGEATKEPTFGLPAMWVEETHREEALFKGYTIVDPATVITTHLTEITRDSMAELLSYAKTRNLLDDLPEEEQKLIEDIVPAQISMGGIQRILQNLLTERVSIRDLSTILEGIAEAATSTRNITLVTEHVRGRLARMISDSNTGVGGYVPLVTLSPEWEQAFAESIIGEGDNRQLTMAPTKLQQFITRTRQVFEQLAMTGETPILLTSPTIRPYVRSIIERFRPTTVVISQNEIHPRVQIKTLGQI